MFIQSKPILRTSSNVLKTSFFISKNVLNFQSFRSFYVFKKFVLIKKRAFASCFSTDQEKNSYKKKSINVFIKPTFFFNKSKY